MIPLLMFIAVLLLAILWMMYQGLDFIGIHLAEIRDEIKKGRHP